MKQITHVAIKYNGTIYSLPAPNRHHSVIQMIGGVYGNDVQGFLDDSGEFLTRKEAYVLAVQNGQINRLKGDQYYQGGELYSEDLW